MIKVFKVEFSDDYDRYVTVDIEDDENGKGLKKIQDILDGRVINNLIVRDEDLEYMRPTKYLKPTKAKILSITKQEI